MIYVLRSYYKRKDSSFGSALKIGYTEDSQKNNRIKAYFLCNPGVEFLYFIPDLTMEHENILHAHFRRYMFSDPGYSNDVYDYSYEEWFCDVPEIIDFFSRPVDVVKKEVEEMGTGFVYWKAERDQFGSRIRELWSRLIPKALSDSMVHPMIAKIRKTSENYIPGDDDIYRQFGEEFGHEFIKDHREKWKIMYSDPRYTDILKELDDSRSYSTKAYLKILFKYRNETWIYDFINLLSGKYKEAKDCILILGFPEMEYKLRKYTHVKFVWEISTEPEFWDYIQDRIKVGTVYNKGVEEIVKSCISCVCDYLKERNRHIEGAIKTITRGDVNPIKYLSNFFELRIRELRVSACDIEVTGKKERGPGTKFIEVSGPLKSL